MRNVCSMMIIWDFGTYKCTSDAKGVLELEWADFVVAYLCFRFLIFAKLAMKFI